MRDRLFPLLAALLLSLPACADPLAAARATARLIDARIEQDLSQAGLTPLPAAEADALLRRSALALTGVIPEADEARRFHRMKGDPSDALTEAQQALIASPRFAEHWSNVLTRAWVGRERSPGERAFRAWLQGQIEGGAGIDAIARDILVARPERGRRDAPTSPPEAWFARRWGETVEDLAGQSSRVFLGLQLQCAQCHDHPFADWSQEQFHGYAAFFRRGPHLATLHNASRATRFEPRFPIPVEVEAEELPEETIARGAALMTHRGNAAFARMSVNRVWREVFGRALVEPLEDLDAGAPSLLLDLLAQDFAASGYRLDHLLRAITLSRAFRRASKGSGVEGRERDEEALLARFPVHALTPEQIVDSLLRATGREALLSKGSEKARRLRQIRYDALVAGLRETFEGLNASQAPQAYGYEGTIPQALLMLNGEFVNEALGADDGTALAEVVGRGGSREAMVERLFLMTLARPPTEEELEALAPLLKDRRTRESRAEDIFWALLNSPEFAFQH